MTQKLFWMTSALTEKIIFTISEMTKYFFRSDSALTKNFFGRGKGSFSARENVCLRPFSMWEKFFPKGLHFCFIRANILSRSPP